MRDLPQRLILMVMAGEPEEVPARAQLRSHNRFQKRIRLMKWC